MSEEVTILIKKAFEEDTFKRVFLNAFMPQRVIILAEKNIIVPVQNGCCGCPIRRGQTIKLSSNSYKLEIDKYADISYNAQSNRWEIILPTWYIPNPIESMNNSGFSEYSVISGDVSRFKV